LTYDSGGQSARWYRRLADEVLERDAPKASGRKAAA
jgi:hypothetical protein